MFSLRVYDCEKRSNTKVTEFKRVSDKWFCAPLMGNPRASTGAAATLKMYMVQDENSNGGSTDRRRIADDYSVDTFSRQDGPRCGLGRCDDPKDTLGHQGTPTNFVIFLVNKADKKIRQCSKILPCNSPVVPRFWLTHSFDEIYVCILDTPATPLATVEANLCLLLNF